MSLHTGVMVTGLKEERFEMLSSFEQKNPLAFPSPFVFIFVVQVTKIDSTDRLTVQWVDGSESQFNVHPTGLSARYNVSQKPVTSQSKVFPTLFVFKNKS